MGQRPGEPATFWQRLLAYLLQSVIGSVVLTPLFVVMTIVLAVLAGDGPRGEVAFALGAVVSMWLLSLAYQLWVISWTGRRVGQDYGKHVVRIVVVDASTGEPGIGFGRAVVRLLAMIVSALPLYLGFLAPLWDPERRTWHDRLTSTRVVYAGEHRLRGPLEFLRTLDVPPGR